MEKKENQRITLTKRLLKESLLNLMTTKCVQNITVKELCEAAGINRSTFYKHYGCPADVLKEMEQEFIDSLPQVYLKDGGDLHMAAEELFNYLSENDALAKLMFRDSDTDSEFPSLLFRAAHVNELYDKTLSGVSDPYSKKILFTFLMNGTYHMIRRWLLDDIPKTPHEMGELVNILSSQIHL